MKDRQTVALTTTRRIDHKVNEGTEWYFCLWLEASKQCLAVTRPVSGKVVVSAEVR